LMRLRGRITIDPVHGRSTRADRTMRAVVTPDRVQQTIVIVLSRTIRAYGIDHAATTGSGITYWRLAVRR
jgi:hypothetical protein